MRRSKPGGDFTGKRYHDVIKLACVDKKLGCQTKPDRTTVGRRMDRKAESGGDGGGIEMQRFAHARLAEAENGWKGGGRKR
jgi:hypothetical protein